jgi:uncharacterized protein
MRSAMITASTPCINICQIDRITGLCIGCGRTTDEIGLWGALPEETRKAVMLTLPERLASAWKERARVMRDRRRESA